MKVKDVMHKGVEWFGPDTPISELAKTMDREDIGSIPIGENDKLVGMVTDRDIALRGLSDGQDPSQTCARDVMSKGVFYCRDSDKLDKALETMEGKKVRRLPVIDANKRMVGMLSIGDVASAGSSKLTAEIVSAVADHHP